MKIMFKDALIDELFDHGGAEGLGGAADDVDVGLSLFTVRRGPGWRDAKGLILGGGWCGVDLGRRRLILPRFNIPPLPALHHVIAFGANRAAIFVAAQLRAVSADLTLSHWSCLEGRPPIKRHFKARHGINNPPRSVWKVS